MMRKPNIASAGSDLAYALIALVIGWVGGAPLHAALHALLVGREVDEADVERRAASRERARSGKGSGS